MQTPMNQSVTNPMFMAVPKSTAGGANTNVSGLQFESNTNLSSEFIVELVPANTVPDMRLKPTKTKTNKQMVSRVHVPNTAWQDHVVIRTRELQKTLSENCINVKQENMHGCLRQDDCYINTTTKQVFVIENKFQSQSGSTSEKIQTGVCKRDHYTQLLLGPTPYFVHYIFCLNNWFKQDKNSQPAIQYCIENDIPVFWGEQSTYKADIIRFMTECII
jgi:hypothetical protein